MLIFFDPGAFEETVGGTVENQVDFYDRFDQVVLLSAPLEILLQRVAARVTNPYGRSEADQAEIAYYVEKVPTSEKLIHGRA